jgi:hypothetical protein
LKKDGDYTYFERYKRSSLLTFIFLGKIIRYIVLGENNG